MSRTKPVPVCLFEISEDGTGSSIGEILIRKGLAVSSEQLSLEDGCLFNPFFSIYGNVSCFFRAQDKDKHLEPTVWDPPFEDELPVELIPLSPNSEELKPTLTLPTCLKDLRVRVTHVTSPGKICVQLLQFDCQLNRSQHFSTLKAHFYNCNLCHWLSDSYRMCS